jgi:DHA1 family multidrug resistance protein B-like MFS transporter
MTLKALHPNVKIRITVNFFLVIVYRMVTPFLAVYFSQKVGATITGFLFATVILSAVLGGVIGGFYGDRIGRRKLMLMTDLIMACGFGVIALLNSPWMDAPYLTYVVFLVVEFFEGIAMPAAQALLIDSSTSETRRLIFQIQYWVNNLSMAIGSMIGAFLFQTHHFLLFCLVALVTLISYFITLFFITDTYVLQPAEKTSHPSGNGNEKAGGFLKNYAFILYDKIFLFFILAVLLTSIIENQLTNYAGVRMAQAIHDQPLFAGWLDFHVNGVWLLGFLQTENTLLVVVGTFLIAWMVKKVSDQLAIITGVIIFTAGYAYIMIGTVPSLLILAMLIATLGELTYVPIKQAYLADIAPENARSSYMAANSMMQFLSAIIGGLMITIGSLLNPAIMTVLIILFGLAAAGLFFQSGRLLNKKGNKALQVEKASHL